MKLDEYLAVKRGRATALAGAIGRSRAFVSQMASGARTVSERVAVRIERATGGEVRRQDLRADWRELWPELADDGEAPK